MAHRGPWRRGRDQAPARPDIHIPCHLTAWSPHRLPSHPPSRKPHGPCHRDPDRAAHVGRADAALVNPSPSPAFLPRDPGRPRPSRRSHPPGPPGAGLPGLRQVGVRGRRVGTRTAITYAHKFATNAPAAAGGIPRRFPHQRDDFASRHVSRGLRKPHARGSWTRPWQP
jgi:hypothetical protein